MVLRLILGGSDQGGRPMVGWVVSLARALLLPPG